MLTVIANHENSRTISILADELEKIGFSDGDEVEISKENDEIILRSKTETVRKRKFADAKNKIFEEWHDVFVELAKGTNDSPQVKKNNKKFDLFETKNGEHKFRLVAANGQIVFESATYITKKEAVDAINSLRKIIRETQGEISDLPVENNLETV